MLLFGLECLRPDIVADGLVSVHILHCEVCYMVGKLLWFG